VYGEAFNIAHAETVTIDEYLVAVRPRAWRAPFSTIPDSLS
jgi:hypothetical protein